MQRYPFYLLTACLLLCLPPAMAAPAPAPAQNAPHAPVATGPGPVLAIPATAAASANAFGAAVPAGQLDAQRGGADTVNNNMALDGGVQGNVAHHVVTGANSIDSGSFANMAGIPTVIQNTGANVLIQNATIINLQLK